MSNDDRQQIGHLMGRHLECPNRRALVGHHFHKSLLLYKTFYRFLNLSISQGRRYNTIYPTGLYPIHEIFQVFIEYQHNRRIQ
jgi:hypothetical protein